MMNHKRIKKEHFFLKICSLIKSKHAEVPHLVVGVEEVVVVLKVGKGR